jgi:hypothetical protein
VDIKFKVVGLKEIDDVLKGLPKQVNHKLLQAAHVQALKLTVDKAKLLAPEGRNGDLIDSIGSIKESLKKSSELGLVQAGPRIRRGRYKGNAGHLVEYGTASRRTKRGANRGVMRKKPFMEPAWLQTKDRVLESVNGHLGKSLLNYMKRTIKRG